MIATTTKKELQQEVLNRASRMSLTELNDMVDSLSRDYDHTGDSLIALEASLYAKYWLRRKGVEVA